MPHGNQARVDFLVKIYQKFYSLGAMIKRFFHTFSVVGLVIFGYAVVLIVGLVLFRVHVVGLFNGRGSRLGINDGGFGVRSFLLGHDEIFAVLAFEEQSVPVVDAYPVATLHVEG